jgi:hypothetical protein
MPLFLLRIAMVFLDAILLLVVVMTLGFINENAITSTTRMDNKRNSLERIILDEEQRE